MQFSPTERYCPSLSPFHVVSFFIILTSSSWFFFPRLSSPFMSPIASTGSLIALGSVQASFIWCKMSPCPTESKIRTPNHQVIEEKNSKIEQKQSLFKSYSSKKTTCDRPFVTIWNHLWPVVLSVPNFTDSYDMWTMMRAHYTTKDNIFARNHVNAIRVSSRTSSCISSRFICFSFYMPWWTRLSFCMTRIGSSPFNPSPLSLGPHGPCPSAEASWETWDV